MKPETCYWNEQTAALVGDRIHKIREYLRRKLIRVDPELPWIFYVDPTPGRHQRFIRGVQPMARRKKLTPEQIDKEYALSLKYAEDWEQDNGETFICKGCRKQRPVSHKSKTKKGWCILCRGEALYDTGGEPWKQKK